MRIVHYYRDAGRPSGVTTALQGWQQAALAAGLDSILYFNGQGDWPLPHRTIKHVGAGRQTQVPVELPLRPGKDILVLHEGWMTSNYIAARLSRTAHVPYILVPHGVYEPQVMTSLRMRPPRELLLERTLLKHAAAVHVFYEGEVELVRRLYFHQHIFVLPTGFEPLATKEPTSIKKGYIAWHGRYDLDHKGLDRLLYAYTTIPAAARPPLRLRGVDYKGGLTSLRDLAARLGLGSEATFGPPIHGPEKVRFLRNASAYVFPSRWESQGIALVEALAEGLPTLVSDTIQMAPLLSHDSAAIVIDMNTSAQLAEGLSTIRMRTDLGIAAQRFVAERLSWAIIREHYRSFVIRVHERTAQR